MIVASTRGGVYFTSEGGQESYLQTVFGFLGIADVRFGAQKAWRWARLKRAEALVHAADQAQQAAQPAANQPQVSMAP